MQTQCWICPVCLDDHNPKGRCDTEEAGFELVMELVRLARSDKPYRNELEELKSYVAKYPKVQLMVNQLAANLSK